MSNWSATDLERIGSADEIGIASHRPDGTLRPFITIWGVRVGDGLFVRSAHGPENPWFARALRAGTGRITVEGAEHEVRFETVPVDAAATPGELHEQIDHAYWAKYGHYDHAYVRPVVGVEAAVATLRLLPAE